MMSLGLQSLIRFWISKGANPPKTTYVAVGIKIMRVDSEYSWSGIASTTVQSPPHCSFDTPTYAVSNSETGTCKHRNQGLRNHGHCLE
jgi:hypothetical protein